MTTRERILITLDFRLPDDRLPMTEWAGWWDKTVNRWCTEGLHTNRGEELFEYFGLDEFWCLFIMPYGEGYPGAKYHGGPVIIDEKDYNEIKHTLFTDGCLQHAKNQALEWKDKHDKGEVAMRLWLDGFFWFPRNLFGIEGHLTAFYDYPELMQRINNDLADFLLKAMEEVFSIITPDMVGLAEDMSYNHGAMISPSMFREFLLPYYKKIIPYIKSKGIKILVDSDGKVNEMIPWFLEAGIDGIYPLERQAGVDIVALRKEYPGFIFMGAYDKMVMSKDEPTMRAEFERLLPVMKLGGFIPGVDHQTPPEVSLENYRIYLKLFEEYSYKAVEK